MLLNFIVLCGVTGQRKSWRHPHNYPLSLTSLPTKIPTHFREVWRNERSCVGSGHYVSFPAGDCRVSNPTRLRLKPNLPAMSLPLSSCTNSYASQGLSPTSAILPASVWLGYAVQLRSIRGGDQVCRVFWLTEPPPQAQYKFYKPLSRPSSLQDTQSCIGHSCARPNALNLGPASLLARHFGVSIDSPSRSLKCLCCERHGAGIWSLISFKVTRRV
jgi:hypothetical protein